jgi:hypothetical protein
VQAEVGVPGLGLQPDDALGSRSRPATKESESIALSADARFSRSDAGAMPAAATDAVLAKEAFEGAEKRNQEVSPLRGGDSLAWQFLRDISEPTAAGRSVDLITAILRSRVSSTAIWQRLASRPRVPRSGLPHIESSSTPGKCSGLWIG